VGVHALHNAHLIINMSNLLKFDFVEADVVFLDATQLAFDEV
jgi:hypothetical protein